MRLPRAPLFPPIPPPIKNHHPGGVAVCEKYGIVITRRRDLTRLSSVGGLEPLARWEPGDRPSVPLAALGDGCGALAKRRRVIVLWSGYPHSHRISTPVTDALVRGAGISRNAVSM